MIEVEKKFKLTQEEIDRLTQGAEFLGEKTFTDVYFDNDMYELTSKDWWLRTRDGKFELKTPLHAGRRLVDQYDEKDDEEQIASALSLSLDHGLTEAIASANYQPFTNFTTTRKKYKKDGFVIDLDSVDFGDLIYTVGEIELLVEDSSQVEDAVNRITAFAGENGLKILPVRGKIVTYLHRNRPDHYNALVEAGVINELNP